jgi:hypothetical protein
VATLNLSLVISAIDQVTAPVKRINDTITRLSAGPRALGQALGRLSTEAGLPHVARSAGEAGRAIAAVGREAVGMGTRLAALAGGAGLAGFAFNKLIRATADYGESVLMASQRLGISTDAFQELSYAASQSSVSADQFGDAMKFLSANMVEAKTGNKEAMDAFRAAGISMQDLKTKSPADILLKLSDAFQRSGKDAEKVKLAMILMGRGGVDMVPFLNSGTTAIEELRQKARGLGLVISEEVIRQSEDFGDQMDTMGKVVRSLGYTIGGVLIPVLGPLIQDLTQWFAAQRQLLSSKAAEWAQDFADALPAIVDGAREVFAALKETAQAVRWIGDTFGWGLTVGVTFGAWIGGPLIIAVLAAVKAFAALGGVMMTTPFGWMIAGVAAVAAAALLLWRNWDAVMRGLGQAWRAFDAPLLQAVDAIWSAFEMVGGLLGDAWRSAMAILGAGLSFVEGVVASVRGAFERDFVGGIITVLQLFDPVSLVARGVNALVSYLFGVDLLKIGSDWIGRLWTGMQSNIPDWAKSALGIGGPAASGPALGPAAPSAAPGRAQVNMNAAAVVRFENAPAGTTVKSLSASPGFDLDLSLGPAMAVY